MISNQPFSQTGSPLGRLPKGWGLKQLKDLTTKVGSGSTPRGGSENYLKIRHNFALIRSQNVFDRYFDEEGLAFISDEQALQLQAVRVQPGDILLNITGDGITFGRACLAPEIILPACVNQHVAIIRLNQNECSPGFVLAYLTHPTIKRYIESFNSGGSRRAITKGHIESFEIPMPPLPEQQAIARILGAFDDKIELNRRTNRTLEEIVRAIFHSWFVAFDPVHAKAARRAPSAPATATLFPSSFQASELGPIPEGWRVINLGELFPNNRDCVLTGPFGSNLHASDYKDEGVPLILVKHVIDGKILEEDLPLVGNHKLLELERYQLKEGDIVFTRVGAVGRSAYIHKRHSGWMISGQMLRVRVPDQNVLNSRYLSQVYLEQSFVNMVESFALGTTRPSLNTNILQSFKFLLPTNPLQSHFARTVKPIDVQIQHNAEEIRTLTTLRDTLLPKLLSGQLRIPNIEGQLSLVGV